MAILEAKGYVNKPATKESTKGTYAVFTVAERQKQRDGTFTKVYYDCVDFNNEAPPESSFVTIKGYLTMREYQHNGAKKVGYSVNVQELEIAPPREGSPAPRGAGPTDDEFGF